MRSTFATASRYLLLRFTMASALDLYSRRTGRSHDDAARVLHVTRVQIVHLDLRDLLHLSHRDGADDLLADVGRALLHSGGLLQQHRGGRRLQDEVERAVLVDVDLD